MDSGESSDNETVKFFSASKVKKRIVKVPQNHSSSSLHWVGDPDYSWTLVNALIWDWVVFNKNLKFLRGQACRLRCSSVGCGLTPVVAATAVSGVVEGEPVTWESRGRQGGGAAATSVHRLPGAWSLHLLVPPVLLGARAVVQRCAAPI